MGSPVFLVENFFNVHQFPDHAVSAEEEPTGTEGWRVGTGRRDQSLNKWTPNTANSDTYLDVECDRVRAADMLVMDGHNLAGYDFELRGSQDDLITHETILDVTIPAVCAPGRLDDGVLTEEGVYVRRFDLRAYKYWRPFFPAMGAGLKPEIAGLWLGLSYSPEYLNRPADVETTDLHAAETISEAGWLGRGSAVRGQAGTINLELSDFMEYDIARLHLNGLFARGFPMWVLRNDEQADQAFCVVRPGGTRFGFNLGQQWSYESAQIPYIEHEPSEDR